MTGPLEEGFKAAGNVTEALKSSPILLALVLLNAAIVGFLFWSEYQASNRASETRELFKAMFNQCLQRGSQLTAPIQQPR
jgi:hypothetical protein